MNRKLFAVLAVLALVLGFASVSIANTGAFADFNTQYPGKSYGCSLCHTSVPALNPYGAALLAQGATGGNILPAMFTAVEGADSDGDGATNIAEINASTLPGDPASIPPPPGVPVAVTSPNGGEVIPSGSTSVIAYTAPAEVTSVRVKFSLTGPLGPWLTAADAGGSVIGSFNWAVPTPLKNLKKVFVKVTGFNSQNVRVGRPDRSDAAFTIETINLPTPASPVTKGSTLPVSWTINGTKAPAASATLFFTFNNGLTWKKAAGTPGADPLRSFNWTVPSPAVAKNAKLRVVLKDAGGVTVGIAVSGTFAVQ